MREIRTSGLMSGVGKRGGAFASVLAPNLDSTRPGTDVAQAVQPAVSRVVSTLVDARDSLPWPKRRHEWRRSRLDSLRHVPAQIAVRNAD